MARKGVFVSYAHRDVDYFEALKQPLEVAELTGLLQV